MDSSRYEIDTDDEEVGDIFALDQLTIQTIPTGTAPTPLPSQSPGSPRPPIVRQFSPTILLRANQNNSSASSRAHGVQQNPKKNFISFKDYLKIFFAVLAGIILFSSIALLILSILTPSLITPIFSPTLNIVQVQIISGFGIMIGAVWSIMQIRNYYNKIFNNDNDTSTHHFEIT